MNNYRRMETHWTRIRTESERIREYEPSLYTAFQPNYAADSTYRPQAESAVTRCPHCHAVIEAAHPRSQLR
jgi:hypothetical protein